MLFNEKYYPSPNLYGTGSIIKKFLKLESNYILPITIPHGVNPPHDNTRTILDIHNHEPIYGI